ncbi:MAG: LLM class flavin-dependent oxidoreductase, partial [Solirubrobacteraceae bacterium]
MQVDTMGYAVTANEAAGNAVKAEGAGYGGWWALETQNDPFLACTVAAERTERIELVTGIAVAFARNPMNV